MKVERKYDLTTGKVVRRQIKIEDGERLSLWLRDRRQNPIKNEEIISFFMPGTLIIEWQPNV